MVRGCMQMVRLVPNASSSSYSVRYTSNGNIQFLETWVVPASTARLIGIGRPAPYWFGLVVLAGVDYRAILAAAEREADVVLWDGGNNDYPFLRPDLSIVVADALRPGHEVSFFPGETSLRLADVVVVNKVTGAAPGAVDTIRRHAAGRAPRAAIVEGDLEVTVESPAAILGRRVLVVEDGPTLTHGEMRIGAGVVAAQKFGARELVDPRPYTVGSITETFEKYPGIGVLLPAMGYGAEQMKDLETTINRVPCDVVVIGTPIDLNRVIKIRKPTVRVTYRLQEIGSPDLDEVVGAFVKTFVKR